MIEKIKNQSEYKEALELIYKETREDLLKLKKEGVIPEWNDDSKESKEWPIDVEKMPFRIDSSTREETKIFMMEKGRKIDVLIKINPEWDICEYIGFPKKYDSKWKEIVEEFPYAGEQLFTYKAAVREAAKAGKEIVLDAKKIEKLIKNCPGTTIEEKYASFLKEYNINFSGMWNTLNNEIEDVDEMWYLRLADGKGMSFWKTKYSQNNVFQNFWFPIRCMLAETDE